MAWFVIKTVPGSQKPRREYSVEITKPNKAGKVRGKGYRIVPKMNYELSSIERSLEENGFSYYMPAEKRLVRDRRHTDLWKIRRFALMVGYVFVRDPHDWDILRATDGVSGIISGKDGEPLPIDITDIVAIRAVEARTETAFDAQSKEARKRLRRNAKSDPRLKRIISKLDMAGTLTVPLDDDVLSHRNGLQDFAKHCISA